jgi:hypothetical protein
MPGELAEHLKRDVALGEHRAERVWQRVRGAAVSRTQPAAACFATISPTAPGDSASAGAERRCNKLTNNASVAAAGRLAYQRRSA